MYYIIIISILLLYIIYVTNHNTTTRLPKITPKPSKLHTITPDEKYISNTVDNNTYKIVTKYGDYQLASAELGKLNLFMQKLIHEMYERYITKKTHFCQSKYIDFIKRMRSNYNPYAIFENDPKPGEETSYVLNKGDEFGICLRDNVQHKLHRSSILEFVVMHELSHLGCLEYGHENEFWNSFKFLITNAVNFKMHNPIDYKAHPEIYCGLALVHNPYFE